MQEHRNPHINEGREFNLLLADKAKPVLDVTLYNLQEALSDINYKITATNCGKKATGAIQERHALGTHFDLVVLSDDLPRVRGGIGVAHEVIELNPEVYRGRTALFLDNPDLRKTAPVGAKVFEKHKEFKELIEFVRNFAYSSRLKNT